MLDIELYKLYDCLWTRDLMSCLCRNYLRKGGYVFACFCLSVCVCVCAQDNSKSYGWIFLKLWKEYRAWHKLQVIQFWA